MYEYRFYNTVSTEPASIYDGNEDIIGTLTKVYSSPIKKALDFGGQWFVEYKITDGKDELVFQSKKDLRIHKKRQYHIFYYKNDDEYYVNLVDHKSLDLGERTTFNYNGDTYELEATQFNWARIKKDDSVIAAWKSSLNPPYMAYFKLMDEAYEHEVLFLMGVFHTYLHPA
ncbi:tubby C-terminal domain-like protein [Tuberibacillus sp. Marseille-P3662]|uniref:tubby C-terminal domain-like protein n=1 Tax=Tuberibacillus sp. Marseille-P3662 TaxID=1965358 RepID=UPI003F908E75